ncbi:tRNA isopentenyltransferase [Sanghuangporus baumii]|uniref:H/ACA ribonucleoprotein complex subunit GAR1 n=1 Tax=Sanghuangporus baumii TaxID=108892 RepID=A0A9Q5HYA6_SANBA|nr:tRNA isopentenyltransferase [Sanghuangporus baumii]
MSRAAGSRGRGGFSGGRGGSRGSFQHRVAGPPDTVLEMGSFVHAVEDEMLCASSMPDKVPYFNAPIYLQNKSEIGKVDEILGPINEVFFSVKMAQGMVASSFKRGDKVYIGGDKLLPIERFLPKPKVAGGEFASLGFKFKTDFTWILHIGSVDVVHGEDLPAEDVVLVLVAEEVFRGLEEEVEGVVQLEADTVGIAVAEEVEAASATAGGVGVPVVEEAGAVDFAGKSKLAVELALAVGGKVINADAMQVYRGLDILTNKLRVDEQRGVEHVLMNFKKPGEQYVVGEWVRDARQEIDKTWSEGKIPIVVGGTSYWIHHLLFPSGLPAQAGPSKKLSSPPSPALLSALRNLPDNLFALYNNLPPSAPSAKVNPDESFALHSLLSQLDPPMASRWHWKDTRKVLRNLEIIRENGRSASEVLFETYTTAADSCFRALIFWLYATPDVLSARLEQRVDDMLSQGLLDEIRSTQNAALKSSGFQEFHDYLIQEEPDDRIYVQAISEMKLNTIKYAKRQVKWIRNKLLPAVEASRLRDGKGLPKAYLLDATDLSRWDEHVLRNAKDIANSKQCLYQLLREMINPFLSVSRKFRDARSQFFIGNSQKVALGCKSTDESRRSTSGSS